MKIGSVSSPGNATMLMNGQDPAQPSAVAAPLKFKNILVPIDFSDCSAKALPYAVRFAQQFTAQLIFLHVLPFQQAMGWDLNTVLPEPQFEEDLRTVAERRLKGMVRDAVPAEVPVRIMLRHGAPTLEIVSAAQELRMDFIVMSTHGHAGHMPAFSANVVADVTRLAPCPVLVVREREHGFVADDDNPFKPNHPLSSFAPK